MFLVLWLQCIRNSGVVIGGPTGRSPWEALVKGATHKARKGNEGSCPQVAFLLNLFAINLRMSQVRVRTKKFMFTAFAALFCNPVAPCVIATVGWVCLLVSIVPLKYDKFALTLFATNMCAPRMSQVRVQTKLISACSACSIVLHPTLKTVLPVIAPVSWVC